MKEQETARQLAETIVARCGELNAPVGLILGTGLGGLADAVESAVRVDYSELDGFPASGVSGHQGCLVIGTLGTRQVVVMQGRKHYFEHGRADEMKVPVATLHALGCETLLLTNAAGSMQQEAPPGSVMLINDHINFTGVSPLFNTPGNARFVDMIDAYDPELREAFHALAKRLGIVLHEGVYAWFCGPNFETPAEIRALHRIGADAVGMSTVPEVIVARYLGMRVAGLSILTNYAAGMSEEGISHERVLEHAAVAVEDVKRLLIEFLATS